MPVNPGLTDRLEPLSASLIRLRGADRRFHSDAAHRLALSDTDLAALMFVGDSEATPGLLGRELSLTTGAITALLDRLEDSGHLKRKADPEDRRRVRLQLTDEGLRAHHEVRSAYLSALQNGVHEPSILLVAIELERFAAALDSGA